MWDTGSTEYEQIIIHKVWLDMKANCSLAIDECLGVGLRAGWFRKRIHTHSSWWAGWLGKLSEVKDICH